MKRLLKAVGAAILGGLCIVTATFCFQWGFTKLSEARQMDRLPLTPVAALAGGPYAVAGRMAPEGGTLTAPYSNEEALYVRYRLEEEYRDSDGDRRTRTLDSGEQSARFTLTDSTGSVTVDPTLSTGQIQWSVEQTYRRQDGDLIYTEWTLQPGQSIQLLGRYQPGESSLVFHGMGYNLPPIITDGTLESQGGKSLLAAAGLISLASALVALGLSLLLIAAQIHRFWIYVTLMSLVLVGYFWTVGLMHLERDWQRAADLYQSRQTAIQQSGSSLAQRSDLYAMQQLIARGARQWPDRTFFEPIAESRFPAPAGLSEAQRNDIETRAGSEPLSRFDNAWLAWLFVGAGIVASLVLLRFGIRAIKLKRLVEHLPTAKSTGLSFGLAELSGVIETGETTPAIRSRLAEQSCVAYQYAIKEKRKSGKKSKWVTIESGGDRVPFHLVDDAGKAKVYPEDADISYPEKYRRREGRRLYTETWLPPDRTVYCLGFAGLDKHQPDHLAIQNGPDDPFLITTASEDEVVRGKGARGFLLTSLSLGFSLFAGTALLASGGQLTPADLLIVALIVPAFLLLYTGILHYNDMIFLRNRADQAWSNINTVLQKRYDLWPSLQRTVEAFLEHEKSLMQSITQLRESPPRENQSPDQLQDRLESEQQVSKRLIARVEEYPDLKGNEVIQQFMSQMEETENYLSLLRNGYSDAVEVYNSRIQSFPDVILAKLFGFSGKRPFRRQEEVA